MEAEQRRSPQRPAGAFAHEDVELVDGQRGEVTSLGVRRTGQQIVDVGGRFDADGGQQTDRFVGEPAEGERQGRPGRRIDPLRIVDGEQQGRVDAQRAKGVGEGDRDDVWLHAVGPGVVEQHRHGEGAPLRRR